MAVFVDWTFPETRCNQRHPQSDGAGNTRYQTTRAPKKTWHQQMKEDMAGVSVTQDVEGVDKMWKRQGTH